MNSGDRFVQTLKKLGYPKASKLDGEDFDWLFETTDARSFLDWFCASVTEQNVVSEENIKAFNELKESGKAVLDEKALEEVMKTCKPSSSKDCALEEVAVEKLEEELHSLQKLRSLRLQRRNKLQILASTNIHSCLKFKDEEDEEAKALNETLSVLQVTSNKINRELQAVVEGVQKLLSFYRFQEKGQTSSSPIFLFQVLLNKYLSCEEQSTAALTQFTKEHFFKGMSKCVEGTDDDFELIQLDGNACDDPALEEKCKEMMRLQLAYISARHRLIEAKAKNASLKAGLQWVEANASAAQSQVSHKDKLVMRLSSLKDETSLIENQMESIKRETLPGLVRESAQLLNMPIVKGDYDMQIARNNLYASRQDLVCHHLMKQRASYDLLQLGFELEFRKQRTVNRQLETLIQDLRESAERLEARLMMSDAALLVSNKPRSNIDSRDTDTHGLFQLLDEDNTQKLFRTYSGLETVALKLSRDIQSLKDQLTVSQQEQSLFVTKLESNMETLQDYMYRDGTDLMLNTPEVSSSFLQVHSHLDKLNQILLEVLEDLRVKQKILQSSKFEKLEKELFVYFFKNEELLKSVVQNLESQAETCTL